MSLGLLLVWVDYVSTFACKGQGKGFSWMTSCVQFFPLSATDVSQRKSAATVATTITAASVHRE